jgi:endonuclease/exonuclease/phosphatase family metal-dependent hydrolase
MQRLSVLTINIWNRQGPWDKRLPLLRRGIAELSPDLVGLQEVLELDGEPNQAHTIADGLDYHIAYGQAYHVGGAGPLHMGNALLSRWPIVEHARLVLPSPEGDQGRSLLYALVSAPCGTVPVFVTHLSWQFHVADVRARQVRSVDDHVRELSKKGTFPALLMGDMNAEPDSDEMRFLRGLTPLSGRGTYYADCWAYCNQGPGYTFARENPFALRTREPSRRIDYIFARGPDRTLRAEPLVCRVALDQPEAGVFPSDHFGVYAELQAAPVSLPPL